MNYHDDASESFLGQTQVCTPVVHKEQKRGLVNRREKEQAQKGRCMATGSQLISVSGAGLGGGLTTGKSRVSKVQNRGANGIRKLNRNTPAPLPQPACPSRQRQSPTGGSDNEPVLQAG